MFPGLGVAALDLRPGDHVRVFLAVTVAGIGDVGEGEVRPVCGHKTLTVTRRRTPNRRVGSLADDAAITPRSGFLTKPERNECVEKRAGALARFDRKPNDSI